MRTQRCFGLQNCNIDIYFVRIKDEHTPLALLLFWSEFEMQRTRADYECNVPTKLSIDEVWQMYMNSILSSHFISYGFCDFLFMFFEKGTMLFPLKRSDVGRQMSLCFVCFTSSCFLYCVEQEQVAPSNVDVYSLSRI